MHVECEIVKSLDDAVKLAFRGVNVGIRLEEAPMRLVEQQQQRFREARQTLLEIAIGARGPFARLGAFVERKDRLRMQMRGIVVVYVVEKIARADMIANMADPIANMIGPEQAAIDRRREPDQAPLPRRLAAGACGHTRPMNNAYLRSRW